MPITESALVRLRPFAYHSTTEPNLRAIAEAHQLISSRSLVSGTEHESLLYARRKTTANITCNGRRIDIRDQKPLIERNMVLQQGLSLQDYIDELNGRVFFWAGTEHGPIASGIGHFKRYEKEDNGAFVFRTPLQALLDANRARDLFVTRCNSGSPRFQGGKPVPRGRDTFLKLPAAGFTAGKVIELSYVERADLPENTEWARSLEGPWQPL